MNRTESSTLIALADLHTMQRERAERELEQRQAEHARLRQQQQQRERLDLEAEQRQAAEQEARRLEAERQRASEAARARRRIEEIEARARAEQDARLAEVQRELSAALDRHKLRRTGRLAAMGMGIASLASIASIAVWMGTSRPATAPHVAMEAPVDIDALSRGLDQLHEDNASLRDDLLELRARAKEASQTPQIDDSIAEPTAVERPEARPHRPPLRPTTRPSKPPVSTQAQPATGRQSGRLELDSNDLLGGLKNEEKAKPKSR
jgi:DNA repair exonuclease SbcCD ATPase subunit